jgi:hypothetical protein
MYRPFVFSIVASCHITVEQIHYSTGIPISSNARDDEFGFNVENVKRITLMQSFKDDEPLHQFTEM